MFLVADTHVHIYPFYDLKIVLDAAINNLNKLANKSKINSTEVFKALFLAERFDCQFFQQLKLRKISLPPGYIAEYDEINELILISRKDGERLAIFPGRQIVTKEKLEALALLTPQQFLDKLTLEETLLSIKAANGIAVLNWGLGKWLFARAKVIYQAAINGDLHPLCLGDCALRPWFWYEPLFSKLERLYSLPILAGTDPLYFKGEETLVGTYGIISNTSINLAKITPSIKKILSDPNLFAVAGKRNSTIKTIVRQLKTLHAPAKS